MPSPQEIKSKFSPLTKLTDARFGFGHALVWSLAGMENLR